MLINLLFIYISFIILLAVQFEVYSSLYTAPANFLSQCVVVFLMTTMATNTSV